MVYGLFTEAGKLWQSDVRTLYGSPLQAPAVFYKDNDATPYQYPDDLQ